MGDKAARYLQDLLKKEGNGICADCSQGVPEWASLNLGIFLCESCAGIHRSLGSHISKVKSIRFDNWEDDHLRFMEAHGNLKAKQQFEGQVPPCYKRPTKDDPQVLKEQWIRAKYERQEFNNPDKQDYLRGRKEGHLWKRGKDDKKFQSRKFVLDEKENLLSYYTKQNAKNPKAAIRLDSLNVMLVPEKVGNPNAMQLQFEQDNSTRNLFVYAEDGKDLIDWYTAIRYIKYNRLAIAYPGAKEDELQERITRDFLKEGWLSKTGPRPGDAYRKRWMSLDGRKLMYYEEPMDPFPRGFVFIGAADQQFVVREGVPPGTKDPGNTFTLKTPDRHYYLAADSDQEQKDWMKVLKKVIETPLSPQDLSHIRTGASK